MSTSKELRQKIKLLKEEIKLLKTKKISYVEKRILAININNLSNYLKSLILYISVHDKGQKDSIKVEDFMLFEINSYVGEQVTNLYKEELESMRLEIHKTILKDEDLSKFIPYLVYNVSMGAYISLLNVRLVPDSVMNRRRTVSLLNNFKRVIQQNLLIYRDTIFKESYHIMYDFIINHPDIYEEPEIEGAMYESSFNISVLGITKATRINMNDIATTYKKLKLRDKFKNEVNNEKSLYELRLGKFRHYVTTTGEGVFNEGKNNRLVFVGFETIDYIINTKIDLLKDGDFVIPLNITNHDIKDNYIVLRKNLNDLGKPIKRKPFIIYTTNNL